MEENMFNHWEKTKKAAAISENIEVVLGVVSTGLGKLNKNLDAFNVILEAKSEYYGEKCLVRGILKVSEVKLEVQQKRKNDPGFDKIYDEVMANWDKGVEGKISVYETEPVVEEVANFILPADYENAEKIEEIKEKIAEIVAEHSKFLKETKHKLDGDPDLMAIFEEEMEKEGGNKILAHIMAIQPECSKTRKSGVIYKTYPSNSSQKKPYLLTNPIEQGIGVQ